MLTLPLLLDSYTPNLDNLPRLLLKLATEVYDQRYMGFRDHREM